MNRLSFSPLFVDSILLSSGWAITIHKSQGMTFSSALVDLGSAFESGMAYDLVNWHMPYKTLLIIPNNFQIRGTFASEKRAGTWTCRSGIWQSCTSE